ncbi:MAG: carboxysome shell carbonic anhydrase [Thiotrichales bacterium]|nr:carboxysome shell carbonic anhydrase [Thiotrichales bacterium]
MFNKKVRKNTPFNRSSLGTSSLKRRESLSVVATSVTNTTDSFEDKHSVHALVNKNQNSVFHDYESQTKARFDNVQIVLKEILSQQTRSDFKRFANQQLFSRLGVTLDENVWDLNKGSSSHRFPEDLYSKIVFELFIKMSEDFFINDPLSGQNKKEAEEVFKEAGIHAVGIAPCADGRLAHFISYVLRLPYTLARRKAHAGALFDVSESVRNWVFVEHSRFREGIPNNPEDPTRYLKMAVYHFSKADPSHQGCAAHGSDDKKAAEAAQAKLTDFRQAIENRFGCGSTVETMLIGINTDDDSLKIHIPNAQGNICLDRFIETDRLYSKTLGLAANEALAVIEAEIDKCTSGNRLTRPHSSIKKLIVWLLKNNFSQIEYVKNYEHGQYKDLGHAERFIGIGNGFEEVQLRNLSYYSFLDTIEEGANDVDIGIKIFKSLNVKRGLPIPIIIRCDYDGRVPGSKTRAVKKARRLEEVIHNRYQELSSCGLLQTMGTLRDNTGCLPAEKLV